MNVLQAVEQVLAEAEKPLHYREMTERMLQRRLWTTQGKTPDQTVSSSITTHINKYGSSSLIQRTGEGTYALRQWGLPEYTGTRQADGNNNTSPQSPAYQARSFSDAAEQVLEQFGKGKPIHHRDITKKALELGLIRTAGQTPEATPYSQI